MNPLLTLNADGIVTEEEWLSEGEYHRIDGPAYRAWRIVDGLRVLTSEQWWLEGEFHRVDGPAYRTRQIVNGLPGLAYEEWRLRGKRVDPVTLHQAATTITLWLRYHSQRRERIISSLLTQAGMTVFPGLMGLLRSH